jgi:site-specific DNA-methyltransferase (adenine-specific)
MTIYKGNGWEIREGRWQDSAPDSVDVVISDPPYDERTHKNGRRGGAGITDGLGRERIDSPHIKGFEPLNDVQETAVKLIGISMRWVVCFCSIEQVGKYADGAGPKKWIRGGVWVKTDPTPQFTGDRPGVFGDAIAIMHRQGRKRWNRGGHAARWTGATEHPRPGEMKYGRFHPTQKPLWLMLALVSDFSDPGELVWDPYCGSGTTGVACLRLGRRFLGHEMQPHYAKIAAERLRAEERGLTLQDVKRGQTSILDVLEDGS